MFQEEMRQAALGSLLQIIYDVLVLLDLTLKEQIIYLQLYPVVHHLDNLWQWYDKVIDSLYECLKYIVKEEGFERYGAFNVGFAEDDDGTFMFQILQT